MVSGLLSGPSGSTNTGSNALFPAPHSSMACALTTIDAWPPCKSFHAKSSDPFPSSIGVPADATLFQITLLRKTQDAAAPEERWTAPPFELAEFPTIVQFDTVNVGPPQRAMPPPFAAEFPAIKHWSRRMVPKPWNAPPTVLAELPRKAQRSTRRSEALIATAPPPVWA